MSKAIIVLLAGLTCDSKCYPLGAVEDKPGPELEQLAQPGVLHWTGKRAAAFVGDREAEALLRQSRPVKPGQKGQSEDVRVKAPPGSVVVLLHGLTADGRVYSRHEVVSKPGPELLEHTRSGARHWSTGEKAAVLIREEKRKVPVKMEEAPPPPVTETEPEKAAAE